MKKPDPRQFDSKNVKNFVEKIYGTLSTPSKSVVFVDKLTGKTLCQTHFLNSILAIAVLVIFRRQLAKNAGWDGGYPMWEGDTNRRETARSQKLIAPSSFPAYNLEN